MKPMHKQALFMFYDNNNVHFTFSSTSASVQSVYEKIRFREKIFTCTAVCQRSYNANKHLNKTWTLTKNMKNGKINFQNF